MTETEQLAALARIDELLGDHGIEYWVFGGWAVDFHAGTVTRAHHDLDVAVWLHDYPRIAALLQAEGWEHAPEAGEDGYTAYERGSVRLELAFLARDEDGTVSTPLREGRVAWPDQAFGGDIAGLLGVRDDRLTDEVLERVSERATRRAFSPHYKLRILEEYERRDRNGRAGRTTARRDDPQAERRSRPAHDSYRSGYVHGFEPGGAAVGGPGRHQEPLPATLLQR